MNLFSIELKRLFSRRGVIALCLLMPLVAVMVFSAIVLPLLSTGSRSINYAVVDEDGGDTVKYFINAIASSESLSRYSTLFPVRDMETAFEMLNDGRVSLVARVPDGFTEAMNSGGDAAIYMSSYELHSFEAELISLAFGSMLKVLGKAQNAVVYMTDAALEAGASVEGVNAFVDETSNYVLRCHQQRRAVIGRDGYFSITEDFMPFQYYTGAIFGLFAALSMLPVAVLTARDMSGSLMRRGLFLGYSARKFYICRVAGGAVLISLVLLMLFPAGILMRAAGYYSGDFLWTGLPAVLLSILAIALCFSALGTLIGVLAPNVRFAQWVCFYAMTAMALLSGVFFSSEALPGALRTAGLYLPLHPAMRMIANTLFSLDMAEFSSDLTRLAVAAAVFAAAGAWGYRKRGEAR